MLERAVEKGLVTVAVELGEAGATEDTLGTAKTPLLVDEKDDVIRTDDDGFEAINGVTPVL